MSLDRGKRKKVKTSKEKLTTKEKFIYETKIQSLKQKLVDARAKHLEEFNKNNLVWNFEFEASMAGFYASRGNIIELQNMLTKGANINKATYDQRTALHAAVIARQSGCVKYLLENGASPFCKDFRGRTPMDEAMDLPDASIAQILETTAFKMEKLDFYKTAGEWEKMLLRRKITENPTRRKSLDNPREIHHQPPEDSLLPYPPTSLLTKSNSATSVVFGQKERKIKSQITRHWFLPRKSNKITKALMEPAEFSNGKTPTRNNTNHSFNHPHELAHPLSVVSGIKRGDCTFIDSGPVCRCKYYEEKMTPGFCGCGHSPEAHRNMGTVDNDIEIMIEEFLIPKNIGTDWPKIINDKAPPYNNPANETQNSLILDPSPWRIDPDSVEFICEIGKGSSAIVYKGNYENNTIAIKVMNCLEKMRDKVLYDLKQELRILQDLHSEYLVTFYGVIVYPRIGILLEYCPHGTMYEMLIDPLFQFDWTCLFKWYKQTLHGIQYLHKKSIVHRDIKTLNLLITNEYNVKVADFGLSRYFNTDRPESTLTKFRGTHCYVAPEIFKKINRYTVKSDVYSLGIVLWELCYRLVENKYQCPFAEYNFLRSYITMIKASRENVRPTIPEKVPFALTEFIKVLWDPDPELRPTIQKVILKIEELEKMVAFEDTENETRSNSEEQDPISAAPTSPLLSPDSNESYHKPTEELAFSSPQNIPKYLDKLEECCAVCFEEDISSTKMKSKSVSYEPKLLNRRNSIQKNLKSIIGNMPSHKKERSSPKIKKKESSRKLSKFLL